MTLMVQHPSWPDKWLAAIGKQRAVYIPHNMQPCGYYVARREGFLRALLRPRSKQPPAGWVYWGSDRQMTQTDNAANIDDLAGAIGSFFVQRKSDLFIHLTETEAQLLTSLKFEKSLNLSHDNPSGATLFGWGEPKPDFVPDKLCDTIIEVKYVRITTDCRYNECDIKNALSQIIEQAFCKRATNAILLIIDDGRAKDREWNDGERKFVGMFKKNPFGIHLRLVRIRVRKEINDVSYSIE